MSFFGRVFSYVFNQALVDALANNRHFQRFAIRSSQLVEELSKTRVDSNSLAERAGTFAQSFRAEMKKGMNEQFKRTDGTGSHKP